MGLEQGQVLCCGCLGTGICPQVCGSRAVQRHVCVPQGQSPRLARLFCHHICHTGRWDQGMPAHPAGGLSRRSPAVLPHADSPWPAQPPPRVLKREREGLSNGGLGAVPAQKGQCRWPQVCAHPSVHRYTLIRAHTHTCSLMPQVHVCPDLLQPLDHWGRQGLQVGPGPLGWLSCHLLAHWCSSQSLSRVL